MAFVLSPRLHRLAIAGMTALILAAPTAITRAHEFEPGDDHGGIVITSPAPFPSAVEVVTPSGGAFGDDHGLHVEPGDDHGRDG
jgi:hypothetical protein